MKVSILLTLLLLADPLPEFSTWEATPLPSNLPITYTVYQGEPLCHPQKEYHF